MSQGARDRPHPASTRTEHLRASPPMFGSAFLDKFTRIHWSAVPLVFVPVVVAQFLFGLDRLGAAPAVAWALTGYLVWTLSEYWLHRTVFHFQPENRLGRRLHWMLHGVHHDHPNDPLRLVMPPSASLPLGAVFVLLFHLLLPAGTAWALGAGFFTGYMAYDLTHYYLHHAVPRTRVGKRLRENHMRHHFQDDTTAFGVSATFWDRVFRTAPKKNRGVASSPARSD